MIRSKKGVRHVACMDGKGGGGRNVIQGFGWEDTTCKTKDRRAWTGLVLLRIRTSGGRDLVSRVMNCRVP